MSKINNKEFLCKDSLYSSSMIHTKLYPDDRAMIRISDCNGSIRLWNEFDKKEGQAEIFEKIDTIINHLTAFKQQLIDVLEVDSEDQHSGCKRCYIRLSKSYSQDTRDNSNSVMIGMYASDRSTSGEFSIEWENLGKQYAPVLKCYDDAWSSLFLFSDLLAKLKEVDNKDISESELCKILDSLGIKDITEYKAE